ncbi:unnamed protein product [Hydatigera taeniaeformis]|uniref:Uncharacterized protein n=1 Tax=Hydatigena taeniaeformis TaxID=6205 RepID=A0A0R3X9P3_HYDTA|nr:unnamed protein product [Hydatigera taeniaeformis]
MRIRRNKAVLTTNKAIDYYKEALEVEVNGRHIGESGGVRRRSMCNGLMWEEEEEEEMVEEEEEEEEQSVGLDEPKPGTSPLITFSFSSSIHFKQTRLSFLGLASGQHVRDAPKGQA